MVLGQAVDFVGSGRRNCMAILVKQRFTFRAAYARGMDAFFLQGRYERGAVRAGDEHAAAADQAQRIEPELRAYGLRSVQHRDAVAVQPYAAAV